MHRRIMEVHVRYEALVKGMTPDNIKEVRARYLKGLKTPFGKTAKDDAVVERFAENAAKPHVKSAKEKRVGHHQAPMMQGCVPINKLFEKGTNNLFVMRQELVQRRLAKMNNDAAPTMEGRQQQHQQAQPTVAEIQAVVAKMKIKAIKTALKTDEVARYKKNFPGADLTDFDSRYFKPLFTNITDYEHEFAHL